ncbi:PrgI family protein [Candidatus Woesebacteria bacterium]|nr:PrgI family protein [Candidatus Woesebacteria bacterium]
MEAHAIPQNVTSFEFHLVGDMTLKQFIYLAIGCAIAYFLFVFLSPIYPLVAWPGIVVSALSGVAFAFLPIASRPLDYWLAAFLKAIYSPTKRVWKKDHRIFKDDSLFNSRLVTYLAALQPQSRTTQNYPDSQLITAAESQIIRPSNLSGTPTTSPPLPTTDELGKTVDLARQAQNLQLKIIQSERTLNQIKSQASQPTAVPVDYTAQVNKIITDLQTLVTQASVVKQQLDAITKPEQKKIAEKVKIITAVKSKQTQLALTSFPNVISGVVKDRAGNYLEGCIAVIHNKEGLPVRALKTNKLGQFTGSTPLPGGIYTLALEKDGFTFDVLQMELNGEILPPLMITAK